MKRIFLSVIAAILVTATTINAQSDWKLAKDKNGIKVYTRTQTGSKNKEFKAYTTVNAPIAKVEAKLGDVDNFDEWMNDVINPRQVKKVSNNEYYNYIELKVPFPFDNRDMVLHVKKSNVNGVITLDQTSAPTEEEAKKGKVRMTVASGKWILTPEGNTTKIEYTFSADPAGSIPTWVVNMFVVDGPVTTLSNMKDDLE